MSDLERLIRQVRRNCDISDARHAGTFSICGLALRLRDLFKREKGLDPWKEGDPVEVLEWIGVREERWETLADSDYANLKLRGTRFDPFDTAGLNRVLEPQGLYYGAGYERGLKPGNPLSKDRVANGYEEGGLSLRVDLRSPILLS